MARARYLRSIATGVVLPYVERTLNMAQVVELNASEVEEYEASLKGKKPVAKAKVVKAKVKPSTVVTSDISEGEKDVSELLSALENE